MAWRTSIGAVRGILGEGEDGFNYDSETEPSLTPFIRAANLLVTRVQACAVRKGITLSAEELVEIETWVAAHYYCVMDPTYQEKQTGGSQQGAKGVFQGQAGKYLESTRYGQHAILLDASGCLAALGNRKTVRLSWLGKRPSEQIDVVDRD